MAENFIDYVKIFCKSGKGGAGSVHFRREKFVPRGGPDGGDGGRGGHVILRGNENLWTLLHLKYRKHVIADDGKPGAGARSTGKSGKDEIIEVPLGTVARDADTGVVIGEVTEHNQELVLMRGGRGGLGNDHFKSPTNQVPDYAQPGEEGSESWNIFELKLLADVGLVGFPNAGKSTLLSVVSAAKPEIADYPFTTITPNLGMVSVHGQHSFVMADIPGIIEGAHVGKGLGARFLRHIERNAVLLFMVPIDSKDIIAEYKILLKELELHNPELMQKEKLLAITKADLADAELMEMIAKEIKTKLRGKAKADFLFVSAATQFNIEILKHKLWHLLNSSG